MNFFQVQSGEVGLVLYITEFIKPISTPSYYPNYLVIYSLSFL
jgi:hypothetical protein